MLVLLPLAQSTLAFQAELRPRVVSAHVYGMRTVNYLSDLFVHRISNHLRHGNPHLLRGFLPTFSVLVRQTNENVLIGRSIFW